MLALQEHTTHDRDPAGLAIQCGGRADPTLGSSSPSQGADNAPLLTLAGDALGTRYRCWRGASVRRYVFSVYSPQTCPAYGHAVIMVVAVRPDSDRKIVFLADTGCFPEMELAKTSREWWIAGSGIEFHVHLLAATPADRRAVMADLSHARRS